MGFQISGKFHLKATSITGIDNTVYNNKIFTRKKVLLPSEHLDWIFPCGSNGRPGASAAQSPEGAVASVLEYAYANAPFSRITSEGSLS